MGKHYFGSKVSALVLFGSWLSACYAANGEIDFVDHPGSPNGGAGTGAPGAGGGPSSGAGGASGTSDPGTAGAAAGGGAGQAGGVSTGQGGTSAGQGGSGAGAGGSSGGAGGASSGAGGAGGASTGAGGAGGTFVPGPWCSVKPILQNKCISCHSSPPLAGIPMPLVAYADLVAPAKSNPAQRVGELVLARMSSTIAPMPPRPATPATASEIQAVQAWINAGMKEDACTPPPGGGATGAGGAGGAGGSTGTGGTPTTGGTGGGTTGNPFDTPTVCTSNRTMTGEEGATMRPGEACISCHTRSGEGEAPRFTIAGTVYPTAHEPNDCVSLSGSAGAQIVIIDASGRQIPLTVNSVGSFTYSGTVALPFQAKVTRNGLERVMSTPQTVGDCNSCHTPTGANGAPGRIMAP